MSCVFRVWGKELDTDRILLTNNIEPIKVWRKGEPRFKSRPDGVKNENSGMSFEMSSSDFSMLGIQIEDAIRFCKLHENHLRSLLATKGVDGAVADFGCEIHPPGWSSFTFPPELLKVFGSLGISLSVSVYPTDEDNKSGGST